MAGVLGQLARLVVDVFHFVLRAVAVVVATAAGTVAVCLLGVVLNHVCYDHALHRALAGVIDRIPEQLAMACLVVLPPCVTLVCARHTFVKGPRLIRSPLAALIGGVVLGALISPAPGPYVRIIEDTDMSAKTNQGLAKPADAAADGSEPKKKKKKKKNQTDESGGAPQQPAAEEKSAAEPAPEAPREPEEEAKQGHGAEQAEEL
mmetsp:Transcript_70051/g.197635  ORF Transcript_70051/g.197635 Transcript_70051/m.197635 type:complete len:205 (+) Transcript_70051:92-706(+)